MRSLRAAVIVSLMTMISFSFVACGENDKDGKSALDKTACSVATPATASPVGLPVGFPQVAGVTYSGSTTAGPTTVTTGIATKKLGDTFNSYKAALGQAPFGVTKSEKEDDDAEVNFDAPDVTGQVKLRACSDGRTAVQVIARPK
jgi:hypothetical protein